MIKVGTHGAVYYVLFDKSILSVSVECRLQLTVHMSVPVRERRGYCEG